MAQVSLLVKVKRKYLEYQLNLSIHMLLAYTRAILQHYISQCKHTYLRERGNHKKIFFERLESKARTLPRYGTKIVLGDFGEGRCFCTLLGTTKSA